MAVPYVVRSGARAVRQGVGHADLEGSRKELRRGAADLLPDAGPAYAALQQTESPASCAEHYSMEIRKRFRFEAAHSLPYHLGKCARPHGHSYVLEIAIRGPLSESGPSTGMVLDFDNLSETVESLVVNRLDHVNLNGIISNPTAENIAAWIWHALEERIRGLHVVVVWVTATGCAVMRAESALP